MNNRQVRALSKTLSPVLTGTARKSAFRQLKRDWNNTPRPKRNAFLKIRQRVAATMNAALDASAA